MELEQYVNQMLLLCATIFESTKSKQKSVHYDNMKDFSSEREELGKWQDKKKITRSAIMAPDETIQFISIAYAQTFG